jgi:FkbM family methyltransferase
MQDMGAKEIVTTAVEEPVHSEAPAADPVQECRRDLEGLANLTSQLIANAGGQTQVSQQLTERLLMLEQRLASLQSTRQHFAVYMGNDTALTWALNRYKMYVDTRDKAISVHLLTEGGWEPDITRLLGGMVKPGMKVVDVGANMGYFSLLMADRVGPGGYLWAFEPDPRNFELLEWNLNVNGFLRWSKPFRMAAFNRRTEVRLWQNPVNLGGHSVLTGELPEVEGSVVTVDAVPLDNCISTPIDVMKIDAEGSEPFIWEGMRQTIERSPNLRILMEFDPVQIRGKGRDPRAFLDRIGQDGFRIQRIRPDSTLCAASQEQLARGTLVMLYLSRD